VEIQRFAKLITTRFSVPERSEGEERSDESTPLLDTNQIFEHPLVATISYSGIA